MNLREQLEALKGHLKTCQEECDAWEIDCDDPSVIEMYENCIDDSHEELTGMLKGMSVSRIVREMDPVMYRCGMNDYVDSLDKEDFEAYRELCEAVEEAERAVVAAEEALEALEEGDR